MNNLAIITNENSLSQNMAKEKLEELRDNIKNYCIPDDAQVTEKELVHFAQICLSRNLNPLAKQIYFTPLKSNGITKAVPVISIDGMRSLAEETGNYAGQTIPLFCTEDGIWKEILPPGKLPYACKIGVYRKDFSQPTYAIANWDSYVKKDKYGNATKFWLQFPFQMLSKCAEALALRKACPAKLSGIYSEDELDNQTIEAEFKKENQINEQKPNQIEDKKPSVKNFKPDAETKEKVEKMFDITNQFNEKRDFFLSEIDRNIAVFCGDLGFTNDELVLFKNDVLNSFKEVYIKKNGAYDLGEHFANKLLAKRIRDLAARFNIANDMKYTENDLLQLRRDVWDTCKANLEAKLEDVFLAKSALLNPF